MKNKEIATALRSAGIAALLLVLGLTLAMHQAPRGLLVILLVVGGPAMLVTAWAFDDRAKEETGEDETKQE